MYESWRFDMRWSNDAQSKGFRRRIGALGTIAVLVLVGMAVPSAAVAAPQQTLTNGGFEVDVDSNSVPDGWSHSTEGGATAVLDGAISHAGSRSVALKGTSATSRAYTSQFDRAATASTRYRVSAMVKTTSVTAQSVVLIFASYDAAGNRVSFDQVTANQGTHGWEAIELFALTAPNATTFGVQVGLEYGSGTAWFDTVSVEVADNQTEVANGNFETDVDSNAVPDGWSHELVSGATAGLVTTTVLEGTKAEQLVSPSTSGRAYVSQWYIPASEGVSYDFSARLKTSAVVMASGGNLLGLDVTFYDADRTVLVQKFYTGNAGTHDWQKIGGRATAPAGTASVTIRVALDRGSGTAWYDKVEMAKVQRGNLINNPSIEADIDRNGALDFWGNTAISGGAVAIDTGVADIGGGSARLSGTSAASRIYLNQFSIPVVGGEWYRLSLRAKTSSVTGAFAGLSYAVKGAPCDPGNIYGTCTVTQQVLSNVELGDKNLVSDTRDWFTISTTIQLPANATIIDFRPYLYGSGSMWVDDARIEKLAPTPALAFDPETAVTKGSGTSSTMRVDLLNTGTTTAWVDQVRTLAGEPACNPAETTTCSYRPHPALDTTCSEAPTQNITFPTATTAAAGSAAFTVAAGSAAYSSGRKAFSIPPGGKTTVEISGPLTVDASQMLLRLQVHEQRTGSCFGFKAIQSGYGAMLDSVVTAKAADIVTGFEAFDAYLDGSAMFSDAACGTSADHRCGWKTTHDYLVTPAVRGEDANAITSLYAVYSQMYDMTGDTDYLDKTRIAADQLVRVQQPDGGFAIPWDYTDPFGGVHSPTTSVGPSTGLAIVTLAQAYDRFGTTAYLDALQDAVDYFTDSPGTTNILWLDSAHTNASVPYHSITYTPTINGVTGPDIDVHNVNALVMEALNAARSVTGDSSLDPWIAGLAKNLETSQRPSGSWPYAWRFVGTDPVAYNFVQARAFADYLAATPSTPIEEMTSRVLGYLGDQMPGFPVLDKDLAAVRDMNMTRYWQNYIASGLCSPSATGCVPKAPGGTNDRTGTAFYQYAVTSLREAGWND